MEIVMVKFVEIIKDRDSFSLREVFINPSHIVSLREDNFMKRNLEEGKLPADMDLRQDFTKITLNKGTTGQELVVVGTPSLVETKLNGGSKELLRG
jgi:hypothetical protein